MAKSKPVELIVTVASRDAAAQIVRAITASKIPASVDVIGDSTPEPEPDIMSDKLRMLLGEEEETPADVAHASTKDDQIAALLAQVKTLRGMGDATVEPVARGGTQATRTGNGRVKLYSPAGTNRQMLKSLESLRAGTLDAFVLADVIAKPGSRNAEIRERLAKNKAFIKANLSVESVDNVIWRLVNKGLIAKTDAK